ncbi:Hypothetical protein A7982_08440 [Minicystis rosea]|nr:Hypothetical protein A7982_08440 [Minicystis rosea]
MAKTTYQTYTDETSIDTYRTDFIHRGAMCGALAKRYPDLASVGAEADAIVGQLDARRAALQQAEDDQIRARAVEDAEKLDVIDVYTELRRTLAVKGDVTALLPDAPSTLGRLGAKSFGERADQAVANLNALPDGDPVKATLLPKLKLELDGFHEADLAEDAVRANLQSGRTALVLYKTELTQAREAQLGTIQNILRDREKTAQFTLPWRKATKATAEEPAPAPSPVHP